MRSPILVASLAFSLLLIPIPSRSQPQPPSRASVQGFNCSANRTAYPCHAYALYRAGVPPDLVSVGDLFSVSRFMVAHSNKLSTAAVPGPEQPLLVPLPCGCPPGSGYAYAPTAYQINSGDTYWIVSTTMLQNLTQYQAVERVNPLLVPTNLTVGVMVTFPVFCQCPRAAAAAATALVTYVMQPSETYASIAAAFAVDARSLVALNGPERQVQPYSAILVPLLSPPSQSPPPIVLGSSTASGRGF